MCSAVIYQHFWLCPVTSTLLPWWLGPTVAALPPYFPYFIQAFLSRLSILWVSWWFPTVFFFYPKNSDWFRNWYHKVSCRQLTLRKSDKIGNGWMTLKLPLRNTVAKLMLKPLLMVTSNADWEYDLRRTVWRALRVQWWPMRWLLLIVNSLMVKKVTCLRWSEMVKDKLRLWSDPVCWWITVSVVFTTLTGFLGAYCGIIGLDWMLENWHGNMWEDLEDLKNAKPLNLIESPLQAKKSFLACLMKRSFSWLKMLFHLRELPCQMKPVLFILPHQSPRLSDFSMTLGGGWQWQSQKPEKAKELLDF